MKKTYQNILALTTVTAVSLGGTMLASAVAYTLPAGANLDSGSWLVDGGGGTTGEPSNSGDTGLINVDGVYNSANWVTQGDILMTAGNIVGEGASKNFNFSRSSAAGTGSFTMTGGTFTSRGILANRNSVTLLGGTWTVGLFNSSGAGGSGVGAGNGGLLTIGGDFSLLNSRTEAHTYADGDVVIQSDWTGSWENDTVDLAAWKAELTSGNYSLDTTVIDATVFDANFQVVGNTLSLQAVPEPSSTALLGLGGLALIIRRRK